jgi:multidrug efflux system membrane fusion protein
MREKTTVGNKIREASVHFRLLLGFSLALAGGSALCNGCSLTKGKAEPAAPRSEGVPVTTGVIAQKDVPLELRAIGAVEAYSVVAVKSQVSGELTKVHFAEGQFVNKGDTLFTIDPRPYETSLRQAEANLAKSTAMEKQAEANLARDSAQSKNATAQAQRYAALLESGLVSRDQFEQFRTGADALTETVQADKATVETAKKAIEADSAAVQSARLMLSFTTVRAPIDGRTGSLVAYQGNLIRTTDTTPLVVINQVNPIHVTFSVPEKQLSEIKSYMAKGKLKVQVNPPNDETHPEPGVVDFVDNAVDNTTGTIKLKASFTNQGRRLWPGQFVNVVLTLTTQEGAVVAPSQAVQTGQQGQFIYVVKPDQTVEMRTVTVAHASANDTIIQSGVKPGEVVVTDGQLRLVPGAKVKVRQGEAGQKPAAMAAAGEGGKK